MYSSSDHGVRVIAVPLAQPYRAAVLWESQESVDILGVIGVPESRGETLVLLGGATEGPHNQPGILAVACPSQPSSLPSVRWRVRVPVWPVFFDRMGVSGNNKAIVPARIVEARVKESRVWTIDLRSGQLDQLTTLPAWTTRWVTAVRRSGNEHTLAGADNDVWLLPTSAGAAGNVQIVRGAATCWPAGARETRTGDIEIYLATRHCLWRCSLRYRSVTKVCGTPAEGDQPPRIVASDALLKAAGLR